MRLDLLARQTHVELIYSPNELKGVETGGVHGDVSAESAVRKLIKGTDLTVRVHPSGAILIARNRIGRHPRPVGMPPTRCSA